MKCCDNDVVSFCGLFYFFVILKIVCCDEYFVWCLEVDKSELEGRFEVLVDNLSIEV